MSRRPRRLSQYQPIAEGIAKLLHPFAEVVVHDVRRNRIAHVCSGYSRRRPGDPSRIENQAALDSGPDVHGPFESRSFDGRRLKYVSVVLRDEVGGAAGLMCVNLDVSLLEQLKVSVESLLRTSEDSAALDSLFDDDWQTRISAFVQDYLEERGRTLATLSRGERVELVGALEAAGGLRAKNATHFAARVLGVSRATIYNDLTEAGRASAHTSEAS